MSKTFRRDGVDPYARWDCRGGFDMAKGVSGIPVELLPAFIAWLQEGPPKKRWRITKTFDIRPVIVPQVNGGSSLFSQSITDSDIEEVWE